MFRTHIEPHGWAMEDQQFWIQIKLASDQHTLLIATG
jgi:hypothetical protein